MPGREFRNFWKVHTVYADIGPHAVLRTLSMQTDGRGAAVHARSAFLV
jgi:hypothetical protein